MLPTKKTLTTLCNKNLDNIVPQRNCPMKKRQSKIRLNANDEPKLQTTEARKNSTASLNTIVRLDNL